MTRILRSALFLLLAGLLALTGCAQTPPGGGGQATVGLTYIPDVQFAPFYVADAEGLFDNEGVQVELRHHGEGEGLFTALAAGQEQYVLAGGDEIVQARSNGVDVVAIAQYYRRYPVAVLVPDPSDIQSVEDLRGRTVGIPGRYGETWFGLQAALADAGLTEQDVDIQEIGYTQQAALTTGKVEAVVGFVNNDQVQFAQAGIPTRVVPLTASGEVPLTSIVLATTGDHLRRNPDQASKVARGMVEGIKRVVQSPAKAVTTSRTYVPTLDRPGAEAAALSTVEATIPLWTSGDGTVSGVLDPSAWQSMASFMQDHGLIATPVEPGEAMTNQAVGE